MRDVPGRVFDGHLYHARQVSGHEPVSVWRSQWLAAVDSAADVVDLTRDHG